MKRCVFLTMEDPEGFFINDHLTYPAMRDAGWQVDLVPWNRQDVDWSGLDAVVIRSTWDYQQSPQEFMAALESIERSGTRLFNPLSLVRWNLDKGYLRDLARQGVPIVPTRWLARLLPGVIEQLFCEFASSGRLVVKPTISANADDTWVLHREDPAGWEQALTVFADRPLMAQSFVESVVGLGEYSLFYFGGRYSHAILKSPASGDFRVQEEHGGTYVAVKPEASLMAAGQFAMAAIEGPLLYARVDLVRLDDGTAAVMEVELIEPSLYFESAPAAPLRFVQALLALTNQ